MAKDPFECPHTDKWQAAGITTAALNDKVLLLIIILYCKGCGKVEVKADKVKIK